MITSDIAFIREPANAVLLGISVALLPAFIYWVGRQERIGAPALIPNSIWKNVPFTAVCLMVLISFAVMQTMELFVSLLYVKVLRRLTRPLAALTNLQLPKRPEALSSTVIDPLPAQHRSWRMLRVDHRLLHPPSLGPAATPHILSHLGRSAIAHGRH